MKRISTLNKTLCTVAIASVLSACSSIPTPSPQEPLKRLTPDFDEAVIEQGVTVLPDSLPKESTIREGYNSKRFDISVANVPASEVFHALSVLSGSSIVMHNDVKQQITLNLEKVTIYQALRTIQRLYGYDIQRDDTIFIVNPPALVTEIIPFNYLMIERSGQSQISVNSGGVQQSSSGRNGQGSQNSQNQNQSTNSSRSNNSGYNNSGQNSGMNTPSSQLSTSSYSRFYETLKEQLDTIVQSGEGRSFSIEPHSGMVMVTAYPSEVIKIRDYLSRIERQLKRQVVLAVKVIEMDLSAEQQQGVNWNQIATQLGSTAVEFSTNGFSAANSITGQIGGASAIAINNADFSGVLQMLSTQGKAKVLSSPRITALNNQKAVIKVGTDEFFVTDISSTTVLGTGTSSQTPNITLEAFFSGISLDITPQISESGDIMLHIAPSVVETKEQVKSVRFNGEQIELPLAQSNIRQTDTLISAANGEIVVIGGLMRVEKNTIESKVPVLGSIPLLGALFRNNKDVERNQELIILVRPMIVESNDPLYQSGQYRQSSRQLWLDN